MAGKVRVYTQIGKRIAALAGRQQDIAEVLGVSQQSVSKKLRGDTAILVADLERLAKHFNVPLTYFFEAGPARPELAKVLERVWKRPGPLQEIAVRLSLMSDAAVREILAVARAMQPNGTTREGKSSMVAEDPPRRGRYVGPRPGRTDERGRKE